MNLIFVTKGLTLRYNPEHPNPSVVLNLDWYLHPGGKETLFETHLNLWAGVKFRTTILLWAAHDLTWCSQAPKPWP